MCFTVRKMADFMEEIPIGFATGCETVNGLSNEVVLEMCHHVIQVLKDQITWNVTEVRKICKTKDDIERRQIQVGLNAVTHIVRQAKCTRPSAEAFSKKLKSINLLKEEHVNTLAKVWAEQLPEMGTQKADHLLSIGKLLDMQWKVGLATTSSECRNLNKPFVTVALKVQQPSSTTSTHMLEMSIPEFKEFSTQIRNMVNVLETA